MPSEGEVATLEMYLETFSMTVLSKHMYTIAYSSVSRGDHPHSTPVSRT